MIKTLEKHCLVLVKCYLELPTLVRKLLNQSKSVLKVTTATVINQS